MRLSLLVMVALSCGGGLLAQKAAPVAPAPIDVETVCAQVDATPVPTEYLRSVTADEKAAKNCSPLRLYYDESAPNHFERARTCGLGQWELIKAEEKAGTADDDRDVDADEQLALAMLFANGQGVRKNVALAKRFACEADNFVNTDQVLAAINAGDFDACSEDYGRRINYLCLGIKGGEVDGRRKVAELQAKKALHGTALMAWRRLEAARSAYLTAHEPEEPTGNTGSVQYAMQEELDADTAWLGVLASVAAGKVPDGVVDAPAFADVDKQLNDAYQQALNFGVDNCEGGQDCASSESTRAAERAWLKYREAWVKFGAVRWPKTPADQWRAWLTVDRTTALGG